LANPVAFWIDGRNRVFVAETFRLHKGVTDNRQFGREWLEADLACRTVDDRIAMYRRLRADALPSLLTEHERVRVLRDTDGDGRADASEVFADGFRQLEDGIGSGVLEHDGDVFFTCIPKLWRLRDRDGDQRADERTVLHEGFGVHTALLGHDMHGLCLGPDGRLYFSIGDRGLQVRTDEGTLAYPDEGAVLRCELDGSRLEVFHRGLRNPQELAFDQWGDLFTGDNNSDGGDRARFVYLMEGGDCGWRIGFQSLSDRGPWNQEKLWHPPHRGQAAYVVPPIVNTASGPSGLCYDPGTGLPERLRRHFLLCDFRGSSGSSGVFALRLEAKGAGFEMAEPWPLITSVLATDVDIGPDGSVYVLDWVEGWNQPMKGRIYTLRWAGADADPAVAEVHALLAEGWKHRPDAALVALLGHRDRRVRQGAQFALAARGAAVTTPLQRTALSIEAPRLARIHAIWALGQQARTAGSDGLQPLLPLFSDPDHEIRAQVTRVCGDVAYAGARAKLISALRDGSSRVRSLAAIAVGGLRAGRALDPLLQLARDNDDRDPWLRHAVVMGLAGMPLAALLEHADDASPAVRLALVVALRRQRSAEVARFLVDADPLVAAEAARAIHDVPLDAGTGALAEILAEAHTVERSDPVVIRRAVAANHRLGSEAAATRLAAFAARTNAPSSLRSLALDALASWASPSARDRILDLWRPIPDRGAVAALTALGTVQAALLDDFDEAVVAATAIAVGRLGSPGAEAPLARIARAATRSGRTRADALLALEKVSPAPAGALASDLATDADSAVRKAAMRVVNRVDPVAALGVLDRLVGSAPEDERQNALLALGDSKLPAADEVLVRWLGVASAGELDPALHLDLLEASRKRTAPRVHEALVAYDRARPTADPLAAFREAMHGGDRAKGNDVLWNHEAAACTRCHSLGGSGGNAAPPLDGIGKRLSREQLLESLVLPQASVAAGFGTVVVTRRDDSVVAGVLRREADRVLEMLTADGEVVTVKVADVASRTDPISTMPPMGAILDKRQLRDVVEFLTRQQTEPKAGGH
ncbi:MAG: HEAT repeat domain-containing protein, partial [Phycisphaerales bacterium]|nr:HEAT repeat domain-containing protein [Phycisphaerales bacterium]